MSLFSDPIKDAVRGTERFLSSLFSPKRSGYTGPGSNTQEQFLPQISQDMLNDFGYASWDDYYAARRAREQDWQRRSGQLLSPEQNRLRFTALQNAPGQQMAENWAEQGRLEGALSRYTSPEAQNRITQAQEEYERQQQLSAQNRLLEQGYATGVELSRPERWGTQGGWQGANLVWNPNFQSQYVTGDPTNVSVQDTRRKLLSGVSDVDYLSRAAQLSQQQTGIAGAPKFQRKSASGAWETYSPLEAALAQAANVGYSPLALAGL